MRRIITCKKCGENKPHKAFGLCNSCYGKSRFRKVIVCKICKEKKKYYAPELCFKCYSKLRRGAIDESGTRIINKGCSQYLGVDVAEKVLSQVFKEVEVMPPSNPGFDFICNKGKKIDVKSSCLQVSRQRFRFNIKDNFIADYFLCIGFNNRERLTPLYLWLIPGYIAEGRSILSIYLSRLEKWDKYKLDLDKILRCCDSLRE